MLKNVIVGTPLCSFEYSSLSFIRFWLQAANHERWKCSVCTVSRLQTRNFIPITAYFTFTVEKFRKYEQTPSRATLSSNIEGNFSISSIRICNALSRHPECRPVAPSNSMQYKNLRNLYNFLMPLSLEAQDSSSSLRDLNGMNRYTRQKDVLLLSKIPKLLIFLKKGQLWFTSFCSYFISLSRGNHVSS